MENKEMIKVAKDGAKLAGNFALTAGLLNVGGSAIAYGAECVFEEGAPVTKRIVGAGIATAGVLNLKTAVVYSGKMVDSASTFVKDVKDIVKDKEVVVDDLDSEFITL